MVITGENWHHCNFGFLLSVAETHAGDDRSDAGTDEDEIRRVKESKEQKGSTVIPNLPTQHTHTHTHTYTHTYIYTHLVLLWIHPCLQIHQESNHLYVHTTTPSSSSSSSLQTSIHQLFRSSPLMFFFFFYSSTSYQDSSYNPHLNLTDGPNLWVRVCWVGLCKIEKAWTWKCSNTGWLLLTHICLLILIMIHRVASENGTKMFCHHTNMFTEICVRNVHFLQVHASDGTIFRLFCYHFRTVLNTF